MLAVIYLATSYAVVALIGWAVRRSAAQLSALASLVVRALPAAAAVHHVPVHQRRGVAGGRHPHGLPYVATLAIFFVLGARVRAVASARHHARPRHLRQLGRGSTGGRRHTRRRRRTAPGGSAAGVRAVAPTEGERGAGHRVQPVVADHLRRTAAHPVLRAVRLPGDPRGDHAGVDRARPGARARHRRARRPPARHQRTAAARRRVPRRVHRHVLHGRAVAPTAPTATSSPRTSAPRSARRSPCGSRTCTIGSAPISTRCRQDIA